MAKHSTRKRLASTKRQLVSVYVGVVAFLIIDDLVSDLVGGYWWNVSSARVSLTKGIRRRYHLARLLGAPHLYAVWYSIRSSWLDATILLFTLLGPHCTSPDKRWRQGIRDVPVYSKK